MSVRFHHGKRMKKRILRSTIAHFPDMIFWIWIALTSCPIVRVRTTTSVHKCFTHVVDALAIDDPRGSSWQVVGCTDFIMWNAAIARGSTGIAQWFHTAFPPSPQITEQTSCDMRSSKLRLLMELHWAIPSNDHQPRDQQKNNGPWFIADYTSNTWRDVFRRRSRLHDILWFCGAHIWRVTSWMGKLYWNARNIFWPMLRGGSCRW